MSAISDLCAAIRELIGENEPVEYKLLPDHASRNQTWTCLDVIEDADLAIEAYFGEPFPDAFGPRYLWLYGLLQAMVVSLEAGSALAAVTGTDIRTLMKEQKSAYGEIVEARVAVSGHPATNTRNEKAITSFHAVNRSSIRLTGYDILTSYNEQGRKDDYTHVDLPPLREKHQRILTRALEAIRDRLEAWLAGHRRTFSETRLIDIVGQSEAKLGYVIGLLFKTRDGDVAIATEILHKQLDEFESRLKERNESGPVCEFQIGHIRNALERLRAYGAGDCSIIRNESDQRIHAFYVKHHWPELEEIARSVDAEYCG
jgi:hypothetical protein